MATKKLPARGHLKTPPAPGRRKTDDDDSDLLAETQAILNAIDESESSGHTVPRSRTLEFLKGLRDDLEGRIETIEGEMEQDGEDVDG
jgi:hypothetical protein